MFGKKRKGYADFKRKRRGQSNIIAGFILLMVTLIILVKAVVPTVQSAIAEANLGGTEATIAGLYTLLLVVVGLIMILAYFRSR